MSEAKVVKDQNIPAIGEAVVGTHASGVIARGTRAYPIGTTSPTYPFSISRSRHLRRDSEGRR